MNQSRKLLRLALIAGALSAACTITAAAAFVGVGTVTGDGLRLRAEPGQEGEILATAALGDHVVVLESAAEGWYQVDYNSTAGYMSAEYLEVATTAMLDLGYGVVNTGGDPLNLRDGPGVDHNKIGSIPSYTVLAISGVDNGWCQVNWNGTTGYVSSDYILLTDAAGGRADSQTAENEIGSRIVAIAKSLLGKPYVYGGKGPNGFDCSGFTRYVYGQVGISLPAGATQQYLNSGYKLSNRFDAQPGDLIFINNPRNSGGKPVSHVGIYIGNGQYIHASTRTYTVKIDDVFTGTVYAPYFIATKRAW